MDAKGIFLDYTGSLDHETIDKLLKKTGRNNAFTGLEKVIRKRVYAILVELLENIVRHSEIVITEDKKFRPYIRAERSGGRINILSGNLVSAERRDMLEKGLSLINSLEDNDLLVLYDHRINTGITHKINGAGLGFMLMKLKSGNNIGFGFDSFTENLYRFELHITVKEITMRKLVIGQTGNSPGVEFNSSKNRFRIYGESRPPDVHGFYAGILSWIDEYSVYLLRTSADDDLLMFDMDFEYFNSSSAKYILDFCKKIGHIRATGRNASINWYYEADDIDMLEAGKEMSKMAKIPFEFRVKK